MMSLNATHVPQLHFSLKENPKFLQKFGLKNDLRGFFDKYFYLLSTIVFLA
jgi:hypothetical protein